MLVGKNVHNMIPIAVILSSLSGNANAFLTSNVATFVKNQYGVASNTLIFSEASTNTASAEESSSVLDIDALVDNVVAGGDVESSSTTEAATAAEEEVQPEGGFKIYIGNLPTSLTENDIRQLFETHGTLTDITVPFDRFTGNPRGFAFITMPDKEQGLKAIDALNDSVIDDRTIRCNEQLPKDQVPKREKREYKEASGTKLYVGNLSFDTTQESLIEYFEQHGPVTDCFLPTDRNTGYKRGFGFVTMADEDALTAIDNLNEVEFEGRTLQVNKSLPKGKSPPRRSFTRAPRATKLYIGNLPFDTSQDEIYSLFEEYGDVKDCYVPMDRETGQSRGFAFVSLSPEDAQRAIDETDGFEFDGRILRVNEAQPKQSSRQERNDSYDAGDIWDDDANTSGDAPSGGTEY